MVGYGQVVLGSSFDVSLRLFQQLPDLLLDPLLEFGSAHHLQAGQSSNGSSCTTHIQMPTTWMPRTMASSLTSQGSGSLSASFLTSSRWKRGSSRTRLSNISAIASPTNSCARRLRRRIARAASASSSQSTPLRRRRRSWRFPSVPRYSGYTIGQVAGHGRVESLGDHIGDERR